MQALSCTMFPFFLLILKRKWEYLYDMSVWSCCICHHISIPVSYNRGKILCTQGNNTFNGKHFFLCWCLFPRCGFDCPMQKEWGMWRMLFLWSPAPNLCWILWTRDHLGEWPWPPTHVLMAGEADAPKFLSREDCSKVHNIHKHMSEMSHALFRRVWWLAGAAFNDQGHPLTWHVRETSSSFCKCFWRMSWDNGPGPHHFYCYGKRCAKKKSTFLNWKR